MSPLEHVDRTFPEAIAQLCELICQPSVSATGEGIAECAELVKKTMAASGIPSEILRLEGAAPVVYGHIESKRNPDKTLLFYNHYDVQPAEPLELWNDPPFEANVKGNKIFGRGASDDKGELVTRIRAVEAHLKANGDVPCNVKFLVEGEEETGSAHIGEYLKKYRSRFSCDGVIWEFGYVDKKNRPIVSLGMKGLLFVELTAREAARDAHSSLAVLIKNPAWRLVAALNTLRDDDGRILIRDWYREVRPLSAEDERMVAAEPLDESSLKNEFGVRRFVGDLQGPAAKRALVADPTCNIAGLFSGYAGEGAKTVLPGKATAKIDFRLVPDMDPKVQADRLRRHLRSCGFPDIKVRVFHGLAAARTDPAEPLVGCVMDAAAKSYGEAVLNVSNAGTGPMQKFVQVLRAPCVAVGSTYMFARIHSPNEFARIDLLKKTTKCLCLVMDGFGRA